MQQGQHSSRRKLPSGGTSWEDISAALRNAKNDDFSWRDGRLPLYVYFRDQELLNVSRDAYMLFFSENALGKKAFPSLTKLESDVIEMALDLFNAGAGAGGSFTSGGTESIFLAVKTARDWARANRPDIKRPVAVLPESAHAAFNKAGHYLNVDIVRVPVGQSFRADIAAMAGAITDQTIFIVGSAPGYPHGVFDPIEELGQLALEKDVWLHIDACFGGFLAPFARRIRRDIPAFDFEVPGVRSLSADIHKYGYGAKGASVVLYADAGLKAYQGFEFRDWPRGYYATETFPGTRPGGAIASAWAVMNYLGHEGYMDIARTIMDTKDRLVAGVNAIDGLCVVEPSDLCIMLYHSIDPALDINAIGDALLERGWFVGRCVRPEAIHLGLNTVHAPVVDAYLADLREAVEDVRAKRKVGQMDECTY
jgi:sphinganine-1-phosphate aldolase